MMADFFQKDHSSPALPAETRILLVDCPDEIGLIARITGVLAQHGCNILSNRESVERGIQYFVMRTEFVGGPPTAVLLPALQAVLPGNAHIRFAQPNHRRIVILATKEPHCLGDLLLRQAAGELNADIDGVISNHDSLAKLTNKFDVPYFSIPHDGISRAEHEALLLTQLAALQPEYVVLAKYMRILSPEFVAQYAGRLINIHHSFLPAFIGASPYRQAYERGVKLIGATAHFVTSDLDMGPIIAQGVIPVNHTLSAQDMARAGRDVETTVLAKALKLVLAERVFVVGSRTIVFE